MSRIGKIPISVPNGTEVQIEAGLLHIKGPKGTLRMPIPEGIGAEFSDGTLRITRRDDSKAALHGLTRSLAGNCVTGATQGFVKHLEIVGVGYRAQTQDRVAIFNIGYSHPIEVLMPDGVDIKVTANTKIELSGIDKQLVSQTAANIRSLRKPDPYKQKGIRYAGEKLRKKEGKTGAS